MPGRNNISLDRRSAWAVLYTVFIFSAGVCTVHAQVAVVTNKSVAVAEVNNQTLLDIFSLEENEWKDGGQVVPVEMKGKSAAKTLFYKYLGRSVSDIKRDRLRTILAGEGSPPEVYETAQEILKKVMDTPGAVGYVPMDIVPPDLVNVVAVIDE